MRIFHFALLAGAVLLFAAQSVTAQQTYCFTDNLNSFVYEIAPDLPTDILGGTILSGYAPDAIATGGRGRSGTTIRHHTLVGINRLNDDPGCAASNGFTDWVLFNGTVTGNAAPFGFSGDALDTCGTTAPFDGVIEVGACPTSRPSPAPGSLGSSVDETGAPKQPAAERSGGPVYCLDDGIGGIWEVFPEGPIGGPTGLITGSTDVPSLSGFDFYAVGGRGRSASTVRHHSMTSINPTISENESCVGSNGIVDWWTINAKVTGGSSPFGFVGDFVTSCGNGGAINGTLTQGACPAPRPAAVPADSPLLVASEAEGTEAAAFAEALGVSVHPNPATDEARIRYALDTSTDVRLVIYDMLGRQIATLVDGTQEAGAHTATFDARGLAAGVYVWQLKAGGQVTAGQLSLTR